MKLKCKCKEEDAAWNSGTKHKAMFRVLLVASLANSNNVEWKRRLSNCLFIVYCLLVQHRKECFDQFTLLQRWRSWSALRTSRRWKESWRRHQVGRSFATFGFCFIICKKTWCFGSGSDSEWPFFLKSWCWRQQFQLGVLIEHQVDLILKTVNMSGRIFNYFN